MDLPDLLFRAAAGAAGVAGVVTLYRLIPPRTGLAAKLFPNPGVQGLIDGEARERLRPVTVPEGVKVREVISLTAPRYFTDYDGLKWYVRDRERAMIGPYASKWSAERGAARMNRK